MLLQQNSVIIFSELLTCLERLPHCKIVWSCTLLALHQLRHRLSIMTCVLNNMLRTIGWFFSALELITYLVLFPNPYLSSSTWDSSTPTPNCPGDVCSTLPELFEIRTYLFLLFLHVFTYPVSPTFCVLRGIPNLSRFISKIIFSMILSLIIHFPLPYPGKCYTCLSLHYLVYS